MTDLAELAEVFDLRCYRCGKAGAEVLEHPAELRAFLHPAPLTSTAQRLERPVSTGSGSWQECCKDGPLPGYSIAMIGSAARSHAQLSRQA